VRFQAAEQAFPGLKSRLAIFPVYKRVILSYWLPIDRAPIELHIKKGLTMEQSTTKTEFPSTKTQDPTKDAGRVRLGGGSVHFSDVKATKDTGRVRLGGGSVNF
jgi:hypothetical protein